MRKRYVDWLVALRSDISSLKNRLTIIDDGAKRSVNSGFIDILCTDNAGQAVGVEPKFGKADTRVVRQTLGYMDDLISEKEFKKVRGIIVDHELEKRTCAAALATSNLSLMTNIISFNFASLQ